MHAYWRAANYLSVGQIYLQENPLLESPLRLDHIKTRLLVHWGMTPGLNFLTSTLIGSGHVGPGVVAQTYLERSYTEHYPALSAAGTLHRLFRQFPGLRNSQSLRRKLPALFRRRIGLFIGSCHGATFDNPDLIVACIIDSEAKQRAGHNWPRQISEPCARWRVLPILHLNGFKIANPTVLARISRQELTELLRIRYDPHSSRATIRQSFINVSPVRLMDSMQLQFRAPRGLAVNEKPRAPRWPLIIFRTPKGWTGPKFVDEASRGYRRAHQVDHDFGPQH
jgi:xylulose-5-phosphate/fructose-6-phosphate phosphoketolase